MATLDELSTARTAAAQKLTAEAQGVANLMAQLNTAQAAYARAKAEGAKADQAYADALREMLAAIEPVPAKHGWHITWPSAKLTAVLGWVAAAIMAVVLLAGSGLHLPHIPVPAPAPKPVVTAPLFAYLIWDADNGQSSLGVRSDATLKSSLAALQCEWRTYEVHADADMLQSRGIMAKVQETGGAPVVCVQAATDTKPLRFVKAPATGAEVLTMVKSIRGQ